MSEIIITYGQQLGGDGLILYISEYTDRGASMVSTIDDAFEPGKIRIDRFVLESMLKQLKHLNEIQEDAEH